MSFSDITCKPLFLTCCNEDSVITATGEYFVTLEDRARNCTTRFRWLVDGRIDIPNCVCSCYRANIVYNGDAIRDVFTIMPIGYPLFGAFEPRIQVITEGNCANFINLPFADIPAPCSFNNIRNITFDNLCLRGSLNFTLDSINDTCGDSITPSFSFDLDFRLSITYLPPMNHIHYELKFLQHIEGWLIIGAPYIVILIVGYTLFASVCYLHYTEYDPSNTKEDYEVLNSLFVGNDSWEQDVDTHVAKQLIITQVI